MDITNFQKIITFKLLLLGDTSVGKTSFILRYIDGIFEEDSFLDGVTNKILRRGDKKIKLNIWDTFLEKERFMKIAKNFLKSIDGIILMYDISKKDSFKGIKGWINYINEKVDISKIALIVVGNKCDLPDNVKEVDEKDKNIFEKEFNMKVIEASAKNDINVNECFIALTDKMLDLGLGKKPEDDNDEDEIKLSPPRMNHHYGCASRK